MLPNEFDYLVRQEQHRDRLRRLEYERLVKKARRNRPAAPNLYHNAAVWLGTKMEKWGQTLQRVGPATPKIKVAR